MDMHAAGLQREFIEAFGNLYSSYGWKRLDGLLIGLLLARAETLSLDDMCAALGRSKGPISESVRRLSDQGLIHKTAGEEHRRDYYAIDPDVFFHNHLRNMQTVKKNRGIAEQFLSKISDGDELEGMRRNLRTMHAFYTLMESFFSEFSVRWNEARSRIESSEGERINPKEST